MTTKVEVSKFKGHDILAIKSGDYNRLSAGVTKWKEVLTHLDEIKAFVEKYDTPVEPKTETKKATKKATTKVLADVDLGF